METGTTQQKTTLAFINDRSPIIDTISKDLLASGFEIVFKSENIEDGIVKLSSLKTLPQICIIDLDFYDKNVLEQLQGFKSQYPSIKLIAHSDIDEEEIVKSILELGFASYLLVGSDAGDLKKTIEEVSIGRRYFSVGVAEIAQEYFTNN